MQRTITVLLALAVTGLASTLAIAPASAADAPKCGLNNGKAATGQPIEIGAIVGKTGPADFSGSAQAAAAYFACVNSNGGINGRPIHYSIEDDQWNPETAAQLAAKLVNDTKVVGMVGNSSFVECAANAKFYETTQRAGDRGRRRAARLLPRQKYRADQWRPAHEQYRRRAISARRVEGEAAGLPQPQHSQCRRLVV